MYSIDSRQFPIEYAGAVAFLTKISVAELIAPRPKKR